MKSSRRYQLGRVHQCEDRPELGGFGHGDELVACGLRQRKSCP